MGEVSQGAVHAQGDAMSTLIRTGISLESDLLKRFDRAISKKGYKNRSEAIRDLVRDYAVAEDVEENRMVVGTLTMVYDHHQPNLSEQLIEAQHHAENKVLAATHVHLDHHNCLEVIIMRGRSSEVSHLADRILSLRGVKHGKLVLTTQGKDL
jgi:CopG family nickel-responsive transcriptional regulator